MVSNKLTELGGIVLIFAGMLTVGYLTQDERFGFIVPLLLVMNMGIGISGMGLLALSRPKLAPIGGIVAMALSFTTFYVIWSAPMWIIPTVIGGVLCIVGPISARLFQPRLSGSGSRS
ncbi:hypothetical protein BV210_12020 [Halorientalis sp. IM1011]|uniref:hypothetical protein n=1 Tax=Halorientalis sp. IM1011 TaxID=1932360 RepID=UPI00097CD22A|nr:hypothetical protein [Halorientalis sp. IM1011]AQL43371.1 hypothetical protein BV210_12020 [Halorientalis sp. IM1011]